MIPSARPQAKGEPPRPPWILALLFLVLPLVVACGEPPAPPPLADDPPSVLLITLDTTRADHLGFSRPQSPADSPSPHLDRLAEESAVFLRAIAQASMTPVSHASIFTGLDPYRHGLRVLHGTRQNRLPDERLTLAEILRSLGYDTGAFVSAFPAGSRFGLAQGFDTFDEAFLVQAADEIVSETGLVETGGNQRIAGDTTDRAVEWLETAPRPFFLWVHYFDPHDAHLLPPTEPSPELARRMRSGDAREAARAVYAHEIRYMDGQIGRLLAELRSAPGDENLLVAVVADHGQGLGEHDWWTHGLLYEEQIRVPMLLRLPPAHPLAGGRRIPHQVRTVDLLPTLLEALGIPMEGVPTDGSSLLPLLQPDAPDPARLAYADALNLITQVPGQGLPPEEKDDILLMVSDGRWKYIHHSLRPEESELYDLRQDPRELHNVIDEQPEILERLRAELAARKPFPGDDGDDGTGRAAGAPLSAEDRQRLEALGYVDRP